jgi:hypothetical protein
MGRKARGQRLAMANRRPLALGLASARSGPSIGANRRQHWVCASVRQPIMRDAARRRRFPRYVNARRRGTQRRLTGRGKPPRGARDRLGV